MSAHRPLRVEQYRAERGGDQERGREQRTRVRAEGGQGDVLGQGRDEDQEDEFFDQARRSEDKPRFSHRVRRFCNSFPLYFVITVLVRRVFDLKSCGLLIRWAEGSVMSCVSLSSNPGLSVS